MNREKTLQSHRAWDPGTLEMAQSLSEKLNVPLVACTVSRLLIEMNRSLDHPELFSEFSSSLTDLEKLNLIEGIYMPYRNSIAEIIEANLNEEKVSLHFSMHSFTPIFNGLIRDTDIGVLFDPYHPLEVEIAYQMKVLLSKYLPDMRVMFNAPYKGTDDGLTTYLRRQYPAEMYAGIEIEVNQKWVDTHKTERIKSVLEAFFLSLKKRKPVID